MMLQSVKLCADKLNSITTTAADPATATSVPVVTNPVTTLPAPVAIANANANGSVFNSTAGNSTNDNSGGGGVGVGGSNNNDKNSLMADNSSLSSSIHLQLQQYQGNFLDTATEPAPAAAPVRFHPYLCPTEKPATASTPATSAPFVAALFPAFLQNSVNSNVPIKAPSTPASLAATSGAGTAALQSVLLTLPAAAGATNVTAATVGATAAFINSKTSLGGNKSQSALHLSSEVTSDSAGTNAACADNAGDRFELVVAGSPPNNGGVDRLADADQSDTGGIDSDGWKGGAVRVDNDEFAKDQPDPDNIKMFVGQIPKSWDETQLHKLFEQYGRVHTLNVLRDKVTSVSRGCCFVTYYTRKAALKAQDALHNIKTLDGMHHPIQMKPADSENRNERKLFVGMLNKKYNEADVRQLFTGHGTIEECTVLRDQNGQSKGCAFVTFATKQNAIGAIKALHQSQTMEGCSAPLVVKFADTQKEKDQKKIHQLQASICGITALGGPATGALGSLTSAQSNGITPTAAATLVPAPIGASMRSNSSMSAALTAVSAPTPSTLGSASALVPSSTALTMSPNLLATAGSPLQSSPYLTTDAMNASAAQLQLFHQLQAFGLHPAQYLQGLNFPPDHSVATASLSVAAAGTNNAAASGLLAAPGISMQNLVALATLDSSHHPVSQHHAAHTHHQTHSHVHAHAQAQAQAHMQAQHAHAQHTAAAQTAPQSLNAAAHAHMAQLIAAQSAAVSAQPMNAQLTGTTTLWPSADSLTSAYTPTLNPLANGVAYAAASAPLTASSLQAAAAGVAGKQIEGPDGSNLFIYHLPQEFTDTDLASTFLPFGNVLSAKVFIDKQTNLSKCFGFVSYDNPHSANAAIQAMHGCQIGNKRLKVQLKRSKDAAKPY